MSENGHFIRGFETGKDLGLDAKVTSRLFLRFEKSLPQWQTFIETSFLCDELISKKIKCFLLMLKTLLSFITLKTELQIRRCNSPQVINNFSI